MGINFSNFFYLSEIFLRVLKIEFQNEIERKNALQIPKNSRTI